MRQMTPMTPMSAWFRWARGLSMCAAFAFGLQVCNAADGRELGATEKACAALRALTDADLETLSAEAMYQRGFCNQQGIGGDAEPDPWAAEADYRRAMALGSAPAALALARIYVAMDDRYDAIDAYRRTLELGLEVPTLRELADQLVESSQFPEQFTEVGNFYARASALDPDPALETAAARAYLQTVLVRSQMPPSWSPATPEQLARERALAVEWLQRGLDRGDPAAATNYGILLRHDGNFAAARENLEIGAAAHLAVAHYQLARMDEAGEGRPAPDPDAALAHDEIAARLGLTESADRARKALWDRADAETDINRLRALLARYDAVPASDGDFGMSERWRPRERLRLLEFLERQASERPKFPPGPVRLAACDLAVVSTRYVGNDPSLVEPLPKTGSAWRLLTVDLEARVTVTEVAGVVDDDDCARVDGALPESVRTRLQHGEIAAIEYALDSFLLEAEPDSAGVVLRMPANPLALP